MFSFDDACRKLPFIALTVMVTILNSTLEQCPPWTLRAWPPLLWQVGKCVPLRLQHLGTQVTSTGNTMSHRVGQTMWAWRGDNGDVGMAWDWVQLARGVVAMADPMAVLSNLRLIDDEGEVLTAFETALHLNDIVHGLPWQHEVTRALGSQPGNAALRVSGPGDLARLAPEAAMTQ